MTAIATLLVVMTLSFLITRLGTVALTLTGMSQDAARLQSVSAYTGVGFTTGESEYVVKHPVRRRILIILMILGNAGIITAVSSMILSFTGIERAQQGVYRILILLAGCGVLLLLIRSDWVERHLNNLLRRLLARTTRLQVLDYASLLQLSGDYTVTQWQVEKEDWVEGQKLEDLSLFQEGISVLGIHRAGGEYVGVPRGETQIHTGDTLILYGRDEGIEELQERRKGSAGDEAHREAVSEQERERRQQREQ